MAKVTIAKIKLTDNYLGLSVATKALVDTALTGVAAAFAGSIVTDTDGDQDNLVMIFKEAITQQVVA